MKLLICTQAVDLDDQVLGFFHRWLEELAGRFERIEVICLKRGRLSLPENVFVHSLGKEKGAPRFARRARYSLRFLSLVWKLRKHYDAVFVHMNEEYVLLGGIFWRLRGNRVVLWRNFKTGSWMTPWACRLANAVCYTSPESYTRRFAHSVQMPIGIDTGFFKPAAIAPPRTILFLGRLDEVKHPDTFVNALERLQEKGVAFSAEIIGDPTDPRSDYAHDIRNLAAPLCLEGVLAMRPGVINESARDEFCSHALYVNLTPSGSFDKTIGEAAACGCIVVAGNEVLRGVVPDELLVAPDNAESVARGIQAALVLPDEKRRDLSKKLRAWVEREHSLSLLVDRLLALYRTEP